MGFYLRFNRVDNPAVMAPEAIIVSISTGAKTMDGMLLKRNPVPKLYKCPLSKTISPMYIRRVMTEAATDGIQREARRLFPKKNEPTNTPTVMPRRTKNAVMRAAERGETWRLPSLQKAVKQARMHRPRNRTEHADCRIRAFIRFFSPDRIICPNPYREFRIVMIKTTEIT